MAQSLFEHGSITSTVQKVKQVRPFVERLITLARRAHGGNLAARKRIIALMNDRAIIPTEHFEDYVQRSDAGREKVLRSRSGRRYRTGQPRPGLAYTAQSVVHRLINDVAPRFTDRPGGYTRIIKLARTRIGDGGEQAILQLVGGEEAPTGLTRPDKTARRRRVEARYAFAARALRSRGKSSPSKETSKPDAGTDATAETARDQSTTTES
jgi:large subunit ribosomal protein L17